MNFKTSIAAAAVVIAASASPAAFAFVRYEPTNPIVQPVHFHPFDTNQAGVVTRSEWRAGQRAFDRHDRNHDGVITAADRDIAPRESNSGRTYYHPTPHAKAKRK